MEIAPLFAIILPFIEVPVAIDAAPSTTQNTLLANAPLIKLIEELADVEKAPCILKINTALEFPSASKVSTSFNEAACGIEYTPESRICPFPNTGIGKKVAVVLFS